MFLLMGQALSHDNNTGGNIDPKESLQSLKFPIYPSKGSPSLATLLVAVTKRLNKSNSRKEGFAVAHSLRVHSSS